MDPKEELIRLKEQALALEDTIEDIDYQIERAMHAVAAGTDDIGHTMTVLTERRNAQIGLMFDLGKVTAQIDDLENQVQEQDERTLETHAVQEWQAEVPFAQDDHLDWLRPVLDKPSVNSERDLEERHSQREGEDRMLADMHREQEPEDYLNWWGKRG